MKFNNLHNFTCRSERDVVVISEQDSDLEDFDIPPVDATNKHTTEMTARREVGN